MKYLTAPLVGFETVPAIEAMLTELDPNYKGTPTKRFPIRYLRYWFMRYLLEDLHRRLGRRLRVLEAGIGWGKMLAFMGGPQIEKGRYALPPSIECWDGLSVHGYPETLRRYSYSNFHEIDLDKPFDLPVGGYDVVIALHVIEHLAEPEAALHRLCKAVAKDGLLIGGSPTMPDFLAPIHERQLRKKYADRMGDVHSHRHLSVISSKRIDRFAAKEKMAIDLLTGTFLLRWSNNPLEDQPWWIRANLLWGAVFPSVGGELCFALRRV